MAGDALGTTPVAHKGGQRDVVTPTDIAVEDEIRAIVGEAFGWPVIGEERGGVMPTNGSPYWLVDPICGTRNFASQAPLWCVNLALVEDGEVTVAAVGDASTGEILAAQQGKGAWAVDGGQARRLAASDEARVIVVEPGKAVGARRDHAARFTAAMISADRFDVCAFGTTLAAAYVATGRVAGYALFHAPAVHTSAGGLVASEAGAIVSDLGGRPWSVDCDSVVIAATPELHRDLVELAALAR